MKKELLSLLVVGAAAFAVTDTVAAATTTQMDFTYVDGDTIPWGNNKMESFDVAIFVPGSTMQGKKINSITVPMRAPVAQNISIWLSSDLALKNVNGLRVADPDILQVDVENQRMITLTLDQPYEITADGVYVGFSFAIKSGSIQSSDKTNPGRYPVTVSEGAIDGGMYIHTTRTYTAWKSNIEAGLNYNADISVELDGEFYTYAVGVGELTPAKGGLEDPHTFLATLSNYGTEALSTFEYTLTTNGSSETKTYEFAEPVAPSFTNDFVLEFDLPQYAEPGHYDIDLTINKVNGAANEAPNKTGKTWIDIFSFIPVHRALMEEYTGLGCGYCPRGYIGMMEMNKRHPDDFIGLAYHSTMFGPDAMSVIPQSEWPNSVNGLPSCYIDRVISGDPYYGTSNSEQMHIDQDWMDRCEVPAPCDVTVTPTWNEDSTMVNVKVTTRFQATYTDAKYRIAYFLVGNGLQNPSWSQSNYFVGATGLLDDIGWEVFTQGKSSVKGLVFDDVVLWSNNTRGEIGSIPAEIASDTEIEYVGEIDLSKVKNNDVLVAQQDRSLFTVVVAIVDGKTGAVVNANKAHIVSAGGSDAIESVDAATEAEVISVTYYDLNGRIAAKPAPGIFIKAETLSDGSVRTSKVVIY